MKPVVDGLKQRYAGKVEFRRLDTTKADPAVDELANAYNVAYVPTFVFINRDGSRSDLLVGGTTEAVLIAKLDALK